MRRYDSYGQLLPNRIRTQPISDHLCGCQSVKNEFTIEWHLSHLKLCKMSMLMSMPTRQITFQMNNMKHIDIHTSTHTNWQTRFNWSLNRLSDYWFVTFSLVPRSSLSPRTTKRGNIPYDWCANKQFIHVPFEAQATARNYNGSTEKKWNIFFFFIISLSMHAQCLWPLFSGVGKHAAACNNFDWWKIWTNNWCECRVWDLQLLGNA